MFKRLFTKKKNVGMHITERTPLSISEIGVFELFIRLESIENLLIKKGIITEEELKVHSDELINSKEYKEAIEIIRKRFDK